MLIISKFSFLASILLIYGIGWVFQISGLLSLTETSLIALLLFACSGFRSGFERLFVVDKNNFLLLILFLYFFVVGLVNKVAISSYFVYIYYFLSAYLAINSGALFLDKWQLDSEAVFKIVSVFGCGQIVLEVFQISFSESIVLWSKIPLIPLDVVSGSFFLKSDAALSYFFILSSISAFALLRKFWLKFIVLSISCAVVFLASSKAAQGVFLFVSIMLLMAGLFDFFKKGRQIMYGFCLGVGVLCCLLLFDFFIDVFFTISELLFGAFSTIDRVDGAHRLAPVGEALYGDTTFFGFGLLAYYNPLEKIWRYYSGHSLFYSFYFDGGVFAVFLLIIYWFRLVLSQVKDFFYSSLYFFVLLVCSLFNFVFTDLGILFVLGLFLSMHRDNQKYEVNLYIRD